MGEPHICIFEQMLISTCRATSVPVCSFLFFFILGCLLVWVIICSVMAGVGLAEAVIAVVRCIFVSVRGVVKMARRAAKTKKGTRGKTVEAGLDKVVLLSRGRPVDV